MQPIVTADDEFVVIRGTVGRAYSVRVRVVSTAGIGPWSKSYGRELIAICLIIHALLYSLFTAPESPSNISVVNYLNSFTVNWDKLSQVKYRIYIRKWNANEENVFTPVLPPYNITGLDSNTRYYIIVEAYNSLGGNNGSTISITAPEGNIVLVNLLSWVLVCNKVWKHIY